MTKSFNLIIIKETTIKIKISGVHIVTITTSELESNLEKYPEQKRLDSFSFLTDVLTGVLKNDYDDKEMYAERIEKREERLTKI